MLRSLSLLCLAVTLLAGCQGPPSTEPLKAVIVFSHDAPAQDAIERDIRHKPTIDRFAKQFAEDLETDAEHVSSEMIAFLKVTFEQGNQRGLTVKIHFDHEETGIDIPDTWETCAKMANTLAERYVNEKRSQRERAVRDRLEKASDRVDALTTQVQQAEYAALRIELKHSRGGVGDFSPVARHKALQQERLEVHQQIAQLASDDQQPLRDQRLAQLRRRLDEQKKEQAQLEEAVKAYRAQQSKAKALKKQLANARQELAGAENDMERELAGRWLQLTWTAPLEGKTESEAAAEKIKPFYDRHDLQ